MQLTHNITWLVACGGIPYHADRAQVSHDARWQAVDEGVNGERHCSMTHAWPSQRPRSISTGLPSSVGSSSHTSVDEQQLPLGADVAIGQSYHGG